MRTVQVFFSQSSEVNVDLPSHSLAAVFEGPGRPLLLQKIPLPKIAPGHVLVRVECCTICGSDMHTLKGLRTEPTPCILGHEIVGRIVELGQGGTTTDIEGRPLKVDSRVVWSVAASCKNGNAVEVCPNCKRGHPQKCSNLRKYGHSAICESWQLSGGLAEYCHLVPGTQVLQIENNVPAVAMCLSSCAIATAVAAIRRVDVYGRRCLIFGAGVLGLSAAAVCSEAGAAEITVCDTSESRLKLSTKFGATETVTFRECLASSDQYDCIIEMSGSREAVIASLTKGDIGASVVLVGSVMPTDPIGFDPQYCVRQLLTVSGVHNYTPEDLRRAVVFLEACHHNFPFDSLVARTFPLTNISEAVALADQPDVLRVAVVP